MSTAETINPCPKCGRQPKLREVGRVHRGSYNGATLIQPVGNTGRWPVLRTDIFA